MPANIQDRFNLRSLEEGKCLFIEASDSEIDQLIKTIHRSANYYREVYVMNAPIFTVSVRTGEKHGVIYGLKKGF